MEEIWKPVVGYEGLYEVSNLGRVKSIGYVKEKILKPSYNSYGYLQVCLSKNKNRKSCKIHRLVAFAFIENPKNKPEINHKDENKTNNKVDNLEWVTRLENINYGTGIERRIKNTDYKAAAKKRTNIIKKG